MRLLYILGRHHVFFLRAAARKFDCRLTFKPLKIIFTDLSRLFRTEEYLLKEFLIVLFVFGVFHSFHQFWFFPKIARWGVGGEIWFAFPLLVSICLYN
jgi:hypothetical protein